MTLIVVESPTKARTFNRILKAAEKPYEVYATVGHFRDIPSAKINIDIEHDFKPNYDIAPEKKKVVDKLLELAAKHNNEVILATDEDREGESISYHIAYVLGDVDENWPAFDFKKNLKRIVFHEITQKALFEALENPTSIRENLVKSQQARRILDRIVGYKISPILWERLSKNWLSAGRVQSVGLRLIVEREKEIKKFDKSPYFQISAELSKGNVAYKSKLVSFKGIPYESKQKLTLFAGEYEFVKTSINEELANQIHSELPNEKFLVTNVEEKDGNRFPPPPYTTSQLQIDSYQKLGFSSKLTMRLAQTLYERGLITYHRTDSFNLSSAFVFKAKDFITEEFGAEYALEKPRGYRTKSKGAQQAHEAIRPTHFDKVPKSSKGEKKLSGDLQKLYNLIFNRAIATQMKEASIKTVKATITTEKGYEFENVQEEILFDGFLKLTRREVAPGEEKKIKPLTTGEVLTYVSSDAQKNETRPPWRYNDASLVRILEEKGIGRPSTYASIISNIVDKQYAMRDRGYFVPTALGTTVSDFLSEKFPNIFALDFTATMEGQLDEIENGEKELVTVLKDFYGPFAKELTSAAGDMTHIEVKEDYLDEKCDVCGAPLVYKFGKYGKFKACSKYPTCKFIKKEVKYVEGQKCPTCGGRLVVRFAPKIRRRFFGCENYPNCKYTQFVIGKPKDSSQVSGISGQKSSVSPITDVKSEPNKNA
ncbi:MAG: type I DNA topoisomerase [Patescibacteria group bacterium]